MQLRYIFIRILFILFIFKQIALVDSKQIFLLNRLLKTKSSSILFINKLYYLIGISYTLIINV